MYNHPLEPSVYVISRLDCQASGKDQHRWVIPSGAKERAVTTATDRGWTRRPPEVRGRPSDEHSEDKSGKSFKSAIQRPSIRPSVWSQRDRNTKGFSKMSSRMSRSIHVSRMTLMLGQERQNGKSVWSRGGLSTAPGKRFEPGSCRKHMVGKVHVFCPWNMVQKSSFFLRQGNNGRYPAAD